MEVAYLTSLVLDTIVAHLNIEPGWNRKPDIIADPNGGYKIDFYGPNYEQDGEYMTVYDDGVVQYYPEGDDSVETVETKVLPLHDRRWVDRLTDKGVSGNIAFFAVDHFKNLRKKG